MPRRPEVLLPSAIRLLAVMGAVAFGGASGGCSGGVSIIGTISEPNEMPEAGAPVEDSSPPFDVASPCELRTCGAECSDCAGDTCSGHCSHERVCVPSDQPTQCD